MSVIPPATPSAHAVPDSVLAELPAPAAPLVEAPAPPRRSAAEEARTLVADAKLGALASITADGDPWASMVTFADLDGEPVLCVSRLALHGRNLDADQRASLAVTAEVPPGADPSDHGRVTLAGHVVRPQGAERERAEAAYAEAIPSAGVFARFDDFTFWVLRVERVRWVGGFGRMASVTPPAYREAEPDPVGSFPAFAVSHLNEDHADALLAMARAVGGHPDATAASCLRADRYGLDLHVHTPRGEAEARVGFAAPARERDGLRAATVELTRRSRALLA